MSTLLEHLKTNLSNSTGSQRQNWANQIIDSHIELDSLSALLFIDKKTALRFQWLLSEIGLIDSSTLLSALPYYYSLCKDIDLIDFEIAFATYWSIAGIPKEQEGIAIALLFNWITDPNVNITNKTRALTALENTINNHPDLIPEFEKTLLLEMEKASTAFNEKAAKALKRILS